MPSPPQPRWPVGPLIVFALLAITPPSTTIVAAFPWIAQHPWICMLLILAYEMLLGIGAVTTAFLRKIWERRADTWADASANRLETMMRRLFSGARQRYLRFFCDEHGDLDMKGISTRGTYSIALEQVFVDVRLDPTPAHRASSDPLRVPPSLRTRSHEVWDYLRQLDQHLVIVGAPGSGKTTLLKDIGLCLARGKRRRLSLAQRLPWTIPLFLPLRDHSAAVASHPEYTLVRAVENQITPWKQAISSEWTAHALAKGQCLDGLDEIGDVALRQRVVTWIEQQMTAYPQNRFVVTSRPLGYRANPLRRVAVLEVQSFSFEQITRFLHSWYLANEIKRAVRDDPGVRKRAHEGAEDLRGRRPP